MARTISEIKKEMTNRFVADETIASTYDLQPGKTFEESFSNVSIENIFFYIVAFCAWTVEMLFDILKADVDLTIKNLKPHSERWYATKAKQYQHGFNLLPESDVYDNSTHTNEEVEASKVVKYSAVQEMKTDNGRIELRIKLATSNGTDLCPLTQEQITGVQEYFKRIKDAGVPLKITSSEPDGLKMTWDIYYDPLILDSNGYRLDGQGNTSIQDAFKKYLQNLPFNGWFVPQYAEDVLQQVEGVVMCKRVSWETQYANKPYSTPIGEKYNPDSGYLRFLNGTDDIKTSDLKLNFYPQSAIK